MSIPRITQILEGKLLDDVEVKDFMFAWARDLSDTLDEVIVELKKLNLSRTLETGVEIGDEDVIEE
jgi:hypothetical protein